VSIFNSPAVLDKFCAVVCLLGDIEGAVDSFTVKVGQEVDANLVTNFTSFTVLDRFCEALRLLGEIEGAIDSFAAGSIFISLTKVVCLLF